MTAAATCAVAGACGDDLRPDLDGGSGASALEVLDPPGESIGLPYHGEAELRVLYRDPYGSPVAGAPVSFELVTSASEATGGAAMSDGSAVTDGDGIAGVVLVSGAERVHFRVKASAPGAPPALFYVAVSEGGFTDLRAAPQHAGFRADGELRSIEVRLYQSAALRCADLDIDQPPESVFPPRGLTGFGPEVAFRNVSAGEPYTLIAWAAAAAGGARLAAGCAELGADQVRSGGATRLPLPLLDRPPALPGRLEVESTFDATPLGDAVAAAGPDAWAALDCPLGRAQLLLDCALDAAAPDGDLDCVVHGGSALVGDVQARRGAVDAAGCRAAAVGPAPSLDAALEERLGPPWPSGGGLRALLEARRAPLLSFRLTSRLEPGAGALGHRLAALAVSAGGVTAELDLVSSDRPVVRQVAPVSIDPSAGRLSVGAHRFTLDYGRFARGAFAELGLAPAGLDDRAEDLGAALYESVGLGSDGGCAAFSGAVCGAVGRAAGCLTAACGAAAGALDRLLDRPWLLLDGAGYDFALTGSAPLRDADGDLVLDPIAAGGRGSWSGQLVLSSGDSAALTGAFSAAPSAPSD
jgi:hypothetical protein